MKKCYSRVISPVSFAVLVFLLGVTGVMPSSVLACSCASAPLSYSMKNATAIFIGKVVEIKTDFPYLSEIHPLKVEKNPEYESRIMRQTAVFEVQKMWKGDFRKRLIHISTFDGTCGYFFSLGTTYLFYGGQQGEIIGTSKCSRTDEFKDKEIEQKVLSQYTHGILIPKILEGLSEFMGTSDDRRLRIQAASIILEELPLAQIYLEKIKNPDEETLLRIAPLLSPLGGSNEQDLQSYSNLAKSLFEKLPTDSDPEIRKKEIEFIWFYDLTIDETILRLEILLKDDSAIVRKEAILKLIDILSSKKEKQATPLRLQRFVEDEKKFLNPDNPEELQAQRSGIQRVIRRILYSPHDMTRAWMLPHVFNDLANESQDVQGLASENFSNLNLTKPEDIEEGIRQAKLGLEVLANRVRKGPSLVSSIKTQWARERLLGFLIKNGDEKTKKNLFRKVLEDFKGEGFLIKYQSLEFLEKFKPFDVHQEFQIKKSIREGVFNEKQLALDNPGSRVFHRRAIQSLIGFVIEQGWNDFVLGLMPEILLDFKEQLTGVSFEAYSNLEKLKPINEKLRGQLEEVYQQADPRSKTRIRKLIDQLIS